MCSSRCVRPSNCTFGVERREHATVFRCFLRLRRRKADGFDGGEGVAVLSGRRAGLEDTQDRGRGVKANGRVRRCCGWPFRCGWDPHLQNPLLGPARQRLKVWHCGTSEAAIRQSETHHTSAVDPSRKLDAVSLCLCIGCGGISNACLRKPAEPALTRNSIVGGGQSPS